MVGLFYIYLPMSWSIPQQIELDIISGKAVYQTFQTGNGGQSILQVPSNSYAVIFGYDFSPAGGGMVFSGVDLVPAANNLIGMPSTIQPFETQQISFYTGQDFFPFIHHVNIETAAVSQLNTLTPDASTLTTIKPVHTVDNTPIGRQVYITANNDVTITHGLVNNSIRAVSNAIPVTNRTPQSLTYGGTAQQINTQTNYGPGATPLQFMQPSPKDFADFGFGLLPANADNQAFATPDVTNGLNDSTNYITTSFGIGFTSKAATNYFLCVHYAIYSQTIPEQRG